jgi:hypothetical protein
MHDDLNRLLITLRQEDFEWLAGEVEATIEEVKQWRDSDPQVELSHRPISDEEELELAIETVYDRLVQPCWMWRDAERTFKLRAGARLLIAQDQSQSNEPFDPATYAFADALARCLAQLWPEGEAAFLTRFGTGGAS